MNRRTFIQSAGAAAAVVATTSQLNAADEARKRLNHGKIYKSVKFGERPNLNRLRRLKELGFDGVEGSAPGMDIAGLRKAWKPHGKRWDL